MRVKRSAAVVAALNISDHEGDFFPVKKKKASRVTLPEADDDNDDDDDVDADYHDNQNDSLGDQPEDKVDEFDPEFTAIQATLEKTRKRDATYAGKSMRSSIDNDLLAIAESIQQEQSAGNSKDSPIAGTPSKTPPHQTGESYKGSLEPQLPSGDLAPPNGSRRRTTKKT